MKKKSLIFSGMSICLMLMSMTCRQEGTCIIIYQGECRVNDLLTTRSESGYVTKAECEDEFEEAKDEIRGQPDCELFMDWVAD